jgi:uncharacterized membrane protein YdjX (TVP38/TMEM64 family)
MALVAAIAIGGATLGLVAAAYILPFTVLLPLALTLPKDQAAMLIVGTESLNFLAGMPIWPLQVSLGYIFGVQAGLAVALTGYVLSSLTPYLLAPKLVPLCQRAAKWFDDRVLTPLRQRRFCGCFAGPAESDRAAASCLSDGHGLLDGLALTVEQRPLELTLALRLNLLPPAGLTSYALGAAGVPFCTFVLGTTLGTLPNTLAYVYIGSLLDSIAALLDGHRPEFDASGTALLAGASLASLALMVVLSRAAAERLAAARRQEEEHSLAEGAEKKVRALQDET